jgi:hypothetical protein
VTTWVSAPLVPVTLTFAFENVEGDWQESVEVVALLFNPTLARVRVQVIPVGLVTTRLTVAPAGGAPAWFPKPAMLVAVIVEVPAVFCGVVTLVGLADSLKSWIMKVTLTL